jgi:hypothetical protein
MYHDADSVNELSRTSLPCLHALCRYSAKTANQSSNTYHQTQCKKRINPPYLQSNRIRHQHSHCLTNAYQNKIFTVLLAQLRNKYK